METTVQLSLRAAVGDRVEAPVLVSAGGFSPRYDLDRDEGVISRDGHDLRGESLSGKVVVFDHAKGGVAAGWAMLDLQARGFAPAALVFRVVNPVFVQGCVLASITIGWLAPGLPALTHQYGVALVDPTQRIMTVEPAVG